MVTGRGNTGIGSRRGCGNDWEKGQVSGVFFFFFFSRFI
jgi:hypothetical protein